MVRVMLGDVGKRCIKFITHADPDLGRGCLSSQFMERQHLLEGYFIADVGIGK